MVSISNVDLVMAALRARLERLGKDKRTARSGGTVAAERGLPRRESEGIGNLQRLPPDEFDRALLGLLLERELGEGLASDQRFKALVERTYAVLSDDPEIRAVFRALQQQAQ